MFLCASLISQRFVSLAYVLVLFSKNVMFKFFVAFDQTTWNFSGMFSSAIAALKEAQKYITLSTLSHSTPSEYSGHLTLVTLWTSRI